ncbi:serine hydrolase domain-containing protein [Kitasatospora phosalacinea]|uniref:serine hydrolase domain-containing protein n=1 Tax=Kitasatospora phosalacinea TaxID=2065 RepID=UPI000524AFF7|nr:serine hydrolase domain-containing protein [Kitasatospora phosalacinea]
MTDTATAPPTGTVHPAFEPVREVFEGLFRSGAETGAALCVYHRGLPVVDLYGGVADPVTGAPWRADTLVALTSVTKTVLATVVLRCAQDGLIDIDRPVADHWPEFAAGGKGGITVATALSHRAGIPFFPRPVTFADQVARTPVLEMLAGLRPVWEPGTRHGYHAITLGFLLTELLRRATGSSEGPLVRDVLARPLGLDLHLGLTPDQVPRVAGVVPPEDGEDRFDPSIAEYCAAVKDPSSLFHRATFGSSAMTFEDMNDVRYHTVERPAAGYATAAAVARLFASLAGAPDGVRLLEPEWTDRARTPYAAGTDQVFRFETSFGLGYMLPGGRLWTGGSRAFGHIGSTGALAFADPEQQLAFAYLPNRMKHVYEFPDRRATALARAAVAAATARPDGQESP